MSSYCFQQLPLFLGALTNASWVINFHVFEFKMHSEIQAMLCLESYMIVAFPCKILLLSLWFTMARCFLFMVCVHVCTCCTFFSLVLGMLHLTVPVPEAANVPGVRSLAWNS